MSNGRSGDDVVSLTEKAYQAITEAIARHDLKPGEPLTQDRLARWLSISRTPVREALRRLEQDGVIQSVAGRGLIVSELTARDVADMLELLQLLEERAAALAAQRRTPEQAQQVLAISEELLAAAQKHDFESWLRASRHFHDAWLTASGNSYLRQNVLNLRQRLQRVTYNLMVEPEFMLQSSQTQHTMATAIHQGEAHNAAEGASKYVAMLRTRALLLIQDYIVPVRGERF